MTAKLAIEDCFPVPLNERCKDCVVASARRGVPCYEQTRYEQRHYRGTPHSEFVVEDNPRPMLYWFEKGVKDVR